jgi:hypothetical protein
MLTFHDGKFYPHWERIEFTPSAPENDFLNDRELWTGNAIYFKNFVHPNRHLSFFSGHLIVLRALIERLRMESVFARQEVERLKAAGIKFPESEDAPGWYPKAASKGKEKSIKVKTLQSEMDLPEFEGEFQRYANTSDALLEAYKRQKFLSYTLVPRLNFIVRSVDLAFAQFGFDGEEEKVPHWIKGAEFEDYKAKGKRTIWRRLILFQPDVGKLGVAIRYRWFEKSVKVAENLEI